MKQGPQSPRECKTMTDTDTRRIAEFDYRARPFPRASGILLYAILFLFFITLIMGNAARLAGGGSIIWNTIVIVLAVAGAAAFLRIIDSYAVRRITIHPDRIVAARLFGETIIPLAGCVFHFGSSSTPYGGATPQRTPMTFMEGGPDTSKLMMFFRSTLGRHISVHINLFTEEDKKRFFAFLAGLSGRPEPDLRMSERWTTFYARTPGGKT